MLCGLTGAGKTSLARELEAALPAVRFNVDDAMIALFGEHMPRDVFDRRSATLQALTWQTARRLVELGVHVVLDYGFWTRVDRRAAAERARAAGGEPLFVYLDVPRRELERRLMSRNAALPNGTFEVTPAMLDEFTAKFETPDEDEGWPLVVVRPEAAVGG
jgi:predicted kinase